MRSEPGTDDRDGLRHAVGDPQAVAGQHVVRQRVPSEASEETQREQPEPDQVVHLTRLAERTGEEHAEHVHHDGGHEHEGSPVVDLPHEESTRDMERDIQRRGERLGHVDALHRDGEGVIRVVHLRHRRIEVDREEDPGEEEHHKAVEGDLAEEERPVIREDLSSECADRGGGTRTLIDPVAGGSRGASRLLGGCCGRHLMRSQNDGPTGSSKSEVAMR